MRFLKFFRTEQEKSELDEEIAAHLAMAAADMRERGVDEEVAQEEARREFGNAALVKDITREGWGWVWLERILQDLRYALRQMRKSPGFALTAILTLALGIGATTLIFSIFYSGIINPYPYKDAAGILQMGFVSKQGIRGFMSIATQDLETVRRASTVQDAMLTDFSDPITTANGYPEDVEVSAFSGNGFDFLGVAPILGRTLTTRDQREKVVVLGYDFCKTHFACDRSVIGKTLDLNRQPYTIVGVMPQRFAWGDSSAFIPLQESKDPNNIFDLFLRPKPRVPRKEIEAQMLALVRQFVVASDGVKLPREIRLRSISYIDENDGGTPQRLKLMLAAVFGLLFIACGNVSILTLGRARVRGHEFAIRVALGASRAQLARQLFTEACSLSMLGGLAGVVCAYVGLGLLRAPLLRSFFPPEAVLSINGWVLGFSTFLSVLSGFLAGLSPVVEIISASRKSNLVAEHGISSTHRRRSHQGMMTAQVALSLLLLVSTGTAIQAFLHLYRLDLGFDPHHVLKFRLPIPKGEYGSWSARVNYDETLRQRLQAIPGVQIASVDEAMVTGGGFQGEYSLPGKQFGADMDIKMPRADLEFIDPQFFSAFHIPILTGRNFTDTEFQRGQPVALLNRNFARQLFGNQNPIGRTLRVPALVAGYDDVPRPKNPHEFVQIVGITGDVRIGWLPNAPTRQTIYLPESLFATSASLRVDLRTAGDPYAVLNSARRAIQQINPLQPLSQIRTYDEILSQDLRGSDRWLSILLSTFSGLALFLLASGIYSITAFTVSRRSHEFGIRMALGANRQHILKIVLFSEFGAICAGIFLGVAGGIVLEKLYHSFLSPNAHGLFLVPGACALIVAIGLLASYLPARHASRLEPASTLRSK